MESSTRGIKYFFTGGEKTIPILKDSLEMDAKYVAKYLPDATEAFEKTVGNKELEAAVSKFSNEVTSAEKKIADLAAAKPVQEAGRQTRNVLIGAGKGAAVALPGAATAYGIYKFSDVPSRVVGDIEDIPKAVGDAVSRMGPAMAKLFSDADHKAIDEFNRLAEGLRNDLPNMGDINKAVSKALSSAHDVTASIPIVESALTVGGVLLAAVLIFEAYRYFN